jgi:hypothetical protein
MSAISFVELNQTVIDQQVETFGEERVREALKRGGITPGTGETLLPDFMENDERLFRRLTMAFSRNLGILAFPAIKAALIKHCLARVLPAERYVRALLRP